MFDCNERRRVMVMKIFENEWLDCVSKAVLCVGAIIWSFILFLYFFDTETDAPRNSSNTPQIERHEFKDDGVICYTYGKVINHSNRISCVYVGDSNAEKQGG